MWLPHGDAREAATWLDRFLVLPSGEMPPEVRGRALACRAEIAFDLQDYDTLLRCAQESLELSRASGDDFPVPTALRVISQAAARAGRTGEAVTYIEEAVAAAEAAGNDWEAGLTQATKAAIAVRQGKLKSAQRAYETALDVLSDNNRWGVAQVEYGMGTLARARGDAKMAVRYFEDAMEIFRELDAWPEIARCQAGIGWIAVTGGDFALAADSLAESLRLNQACGQRLGIARGLEAFAALAAARQQPEPAARLAGAACQLRESLGHGAGIGPRIEKVLDFARGRLGASAAAALFAEGRELTAENAVSFALGSEPESGNPEARQPAWTDPARLGPVSGVFGVRAAPGRRSPGRQPAHPAGARDRAADRQGAVQPEDRRRAGDQSGDRSPPRGEHPGQARLHLAYTSCLMGHPPRAARVRLTCTCARGAGTAAGQYAHRNTHFGACAAGRRVIAFNCR